MTPGLLVLDFDGVVCDGIDEMGESASRALAEVTGRDVPMSGGLRARFAALRPVVESGWEMVALVGVLMEHPPAADDGWRDGARWAAVRDDYIVRQGLDRARLGAALDSVRDRWLAEDPRGWLARHRFYDGIAAW